jgi:hypothetical protein
MTDMSPIRTGSPASAAPTKLRTFRHSRRFARHAGDHHLILRRRDDGVEAFAFEKPFPSAITKGSELLPVRVIETDGDFFLSSADGG